MSNLALQRSRRRRRARRNPELHVPSVGDALRSVKHAGSVVGGAVVRRVPGANRVPKWGWYAFGAAAGAGILYLLFRRTAWVISPVLQQNDKRWGATPLGRSSEFNIGGAGCMLTSLTMAVNAFTKDTLTPDVAQAAALSISAGSFDGPNLVLQTAADALGISAPESERLHDGAPLASMRQRLKDTLAKKGMAVVHVAKDFSATGEHFILVYKTKGGNFIAADPAPGSDDVELDAETLTGSSDWGYKVYEYRVVGVAPVYAGAA